MKLVFLFHERIWDINGRREKGSAQRGPVIPNPAPPKEHRPRQKPASGQNVDTTHTQAKSNAADSK